MNARALLSRGWLLGLLCAVSGLSQAADCPVDGTGYTPPEWPSTRTPTGTWSVTPVASLQTKCGISINENASLDTDGWASMAAAFAYVQAGVTPAGSSVVAQCLDVSGSTYGIWYVFQTASTPTVKHKAFKIAANTTATDCTPVVPDDDIECTALANVRTLGSANDQPDSFTPGDTICVKNGRIDGATKPLGNLNGCAAFQTAEQPYKRLGPTGARDWLVRYQFTGLECDGQPEQNETDIPPDCETDITGSVACPEDKSEKCHTNNGLSWCEGVDNKKNCGFANDKYVCLDSLQPDKCFAMPDGSRLCAEGAPTPPVPDNGTKGVKATPDGNMQTCTGANSCTQQNYYNTTTTTNSSRDPGAGPNPDGSGTVGPGGVPGGTGEGEGQEEGQGSASGGVSCEAAPVCDGDPIQCAVLEQQWRTRCVDLPTSEELEAIMPTQTAEGGDGIVRETYDATSSTLTQHATGWGGGTCIADYQVNMGGIFGTVTIPLSELCWLFQAISVFVMIGAYVSAAKIIVGGF